MKNYIKMFTALVLSATVFSSVQGMNYGGEAISLPSTMGGFSSGAVSQPSASFGQRLARGAARMVVWPVHNWALILRIMALVGTVKAVMLPLGLFSPQIAVVLSMLDIVSMLMIRLGFTGAHWSECMGTLNALAECTAARESYSGKIVSGALSMVGLGALDNCGATQMAARENLLGSTCTTFSVLNSYGVSYEAIAGAINVFTVVWPYVQPHAMDAGRWAWRRVEGLAGRKGAGSFEAGPSSPTSFKPSSAPVGMMP